MRLLEDLVKLDCDVGRHFGERGSSSSMRRRLDDKQGGLISVAW